MRDGEEVLIVKVEKFCGIMKILQKSRSPRQAQLRTYVNQYSKSDVPQRVNTFFKILHRKH